MEVIICDRCGKEIKNGYEKVFGYDLCGDCITELEKWLDEKKKEKSSGKKKKR